MTSSLTLKGIDQLSTFNTGDHYLKKLSNFDMKL